MTARAWMVWRFVRRAFAWRSIGLAKWAAEYEAVEAREREGGNA